MGYQGYCPLTGKVETFSYGFIEKDKWFVELIGPNGDAVHECLFRIQKETAGLDVSTPRDRERYEITRARILEYYGCHFADPVPAYPADARKPHTGGHRCRA